MKSKLIINHLSFIIHKAFIIRKSRGFTLIELILVLTIMATLMGFITINLVGSLQNASLTSAQDLLIADLKQQQVKSMIGDTEGRSTSDSYGIHFDSNQYVTFHGAIYSSSDPSNSIINLESNMQFNNSGFDIIFSRLSGEITAPMIIELQDNANNKIKRIHINSIGVVTQVESL